MAGVNVDMIKFVINGTMGTTSQTWSTALWSEVITTGTPTQANLDAALAAASTPLTSLWNTIKTRMTTADALTGFSAYFYPAGSHTATIVSHLASAAPGTGTGSPLGGREAMVATILSSRAGRSGRGRMYVPYTCGTIGTTHLFTTADCTALANAVGAYSHAMNALGPIGPWGTFPVYVRSVATGAAYVAQTVKVDNKPDSQRRRTDKLAPTASSTASML